MTLDEEIRKAAERHTTEVGFDRKELTVDRTFVIETFEAGAKMYAEKLMFQRIYSARLRQELQYFVDRCEGNHPDGYIRSNRTYTRFKEALELPKPGDTV